MAASLELRDEVLARLGVAPAKRVAFENFTGQRHPPSLHPEASKPSTENDSSYVNAVELMVDGGAMGAPFGAPCKNRAHSSVSAASIAEAAWRI
jgi:hypothetical protein